MRPLVIVVLSLAMPPLARDAAAQVMASERATVSQIVDGTTTTIEYSRPRARGRTELFGRLVRWGETWTPGANQATTLAVTKDVTINGTPVAKGRYSMWFVPARGDWELILDRDTTRFHTQRPRRGPDQVRLTVRPERKPFAEVLTWSFPEVSATGATLAFQWDTVYVPLRIVVPPTFGTKVDADVAAPLVGRYRLRLQPPPAAPAPAVPDTSGAPAHAEEQPPDSMTFTVRYEQGELRAVMDPPMFSSESGYRDWILLPKGRGLYVLGRFDRGELVEAADYATLRFELAGARASGFEVRAPTDDLLARGRRLP